MKPGLFMILNGLLITSAAIIQTQALGSSSPKQKPSYLNSSQSPELAEATRLNTLVAALYRQGEYDKALPLAKRVLTIREKSLGPDHWLVAESLRDLAEVLSALGKHQEAINTYQRFLITFEKTVEAYGPGMIEVLERYICLLMDDGSKDSKPEAALEIQKRLYKLENGFDFDQSDNSPVKKLAKSGLLISKVIKSNNPRYPEETMSPQISGLVIMKVKLDEQGQVVSVNRLCGHPTLANEFEKSILKRTYAPTVVGGKPMKVSAIAMYRFSGRYQSID